MSSLKEDDLSISKNMVQPVLQSLNSNVQLFNMAASSVPQNNNGRFNPNPLYSPPKRSNKLCGGQATETYPFGEYVGFWKNGLENGYGTMFYDDGDKYKGYWIDGVATGLGTYYNHNGDIYIGSFLDGDRHGFGHMFYARGNVKHFGYWKNGKRNGYGKCHTGDNLILSGLWTDDVINGKVIEEYDDGTYFIGQYKNGLRNGPGIHCCSDGTIYSGYYVDNRTSGYGIYFHPSGAKYTGFTKNGLLKRGIFLHSNGNFYDGPYDKNEQADGIGTWVWKDGSSYTCLWKNNQPTILNGILMNSSGDLFEGEIQSILFENSNLLIKKKERIKVDAYMC